MGCGITDVKNNPSNIYPLAPGDTVDLGAQGIISSPYYWASASMDVRQGSCDSTKNNRLGTFVMFTNTQNENNPNNPAPNGGYSIDQNISNNLLSISETGDITHQKNKSSFSKNSKPN